MSCCRRIRLRSSCSSTKFIITEPLRAARFSPVAPSLRPCCLFRGSVRPTARYSRCKKKKRVRITWSGEGGGEQDAPKAFYCAEYFRGAMAQQKSDRGAVSFDGFSSIIRFAKNHGNRGQGCCAVNANPVRACSGRNRVDRREKRLAESHENTTHSLTFDVFFLHLKRHPYR